ncbi:MAG: DUF2069 domain-containing protein [Methylococcaceae bacterium]|nr:DUF2069 domain-containing protein [Methylococcaceae bacterium]
MKSQHFYYATLTAYFSLFFLLILWNTVLSPAKNAPMAIMLMAITPLLLPLKGMLCKNLKSCSWMAYMSLIYFMHGSSEAYVNADLRFLAILEVSFSLLLFFGASFYVRLSKKTT